MKTARRFIATLFIALLSFSIVSAQQESPAPVDSPAPIVTAIAGGRQVRYASLGEVHQTRLQVFTVDGSQVFDSGLRLGNLVDWQLLNQQGASLASGSYLFLVTVKDFSDRLTQKYGMAVIDREREQVYLEQTTRAELSQSQLSALESNKQAEAISPVDRIGAGMLNQAGATPSTDGSSTDGAQPPASNESSTAPAGVEKATGEGTQNHLAKWVDNAGTLGDSTLFETAAGRVGLGTTSPGAKFHVVGVQGSLGAGTFQLDAPTLFSNWTGTYPAFEVVNTNQTNNNVSIFQFADAPSGASHAGIGAVSTNHTFKWGDLFFYTNYIDGYQIRMGIYKGNVGIGTTAPNAKLDVAGTINALTQYNLGGARVLGAVGGNTFVGLETGPSNTGSSNTFVGYQAGTLNTDGSSNTFVGNGAGIFNRGGDQNTYVGALAGVRSGEANRNSFFGYSAGKEVDGAFNNSYFGANAGVATTFGHDNSFFGESAGLKTVGGFNNTFIGSAAGDQNTSGAQNTFIGKGAGHTNTIEDNNTLLGILTDIDGGVLRSTAIGYRATVTRSDALVLGCAQADCLHPKIGIGISSPSATLHVVSSTSNSAENTATFAAPIIGPNLSHIHYGTTGDWYIRSAASTGKVILQDTGGFVGIGTSIPADKLEVKDGNIRVTNGGFIDDGTTLNVPDYVFEAGYRLMPLDELRAYIAREKHLPNMPGAEEVRKRGLNLSQYQMRLLEKIEELTLHALAQQEQLKAQQETIERLRIEVSKLPRRRPVRRTARTFRK